jgi:hypothetical protein
MWRHIALLLSRNILDAADYIYLFIYLFIIS